MRSNLEGDVTVVIPTIEGRERMLKRAVASVTRQTLQAAAVVVERDHGREGAAVTRQRGLMRVETPWVAFLDDDDEFCPGHLEALRVAAEGARADYAYSWYEVVGGEDPMPGHFGVPFDYADPKQTTVTTLVRTDLAQAVGFHAQVMPDPNGGGRVVGGEDYRFTLDCAAQGAEIYHLPVVTWLWHHHGGNTSGLAGRAVPRKAGTERPTPAAPQPGR